MASTSLVRLLRAITDGSFSTMPRPRSYTSVFAVPRSIARSRATEVPLPPAALLLSGAQGVHLAAEGGDAVVRPERRLAVAEDEEERAEHRDGEGHEEEDDGVHQVSTCSVGACSERAQLGSSSVQSSCFQIGADA